MPLEKGLAKLKKAGWKKNNLLLLCSKGFFVIDFNIEAGGVRKKFKGGDSKIEDV